MPIVKFGTKICHFAHIPKCGGSSIEKYFSDLGLRVAFLDGAFNSNPSPQRWNVSSPQHIDGYSLSRLFHAQFFDVAFAVVREPVDRFLSAFKFQVNIEKQIGLGTNVNQFVKHELLDASSNIGKFDNHFLPQVKFFYPGLNYKVFKLENGLNPVKSFIDNSILGVPTNLEIQHVNKGDLSSKYHDYKLTDESLKIIKTIYADDFEKLSYQ